MLAENGPLDVVGGGELRRACLFVLGGERFAVDVRQAREIVILESITRVPGAGAPLLGVMSTRGGLLPVADARPLLGYPTQPSGAGAQAVVLTEDDMQAAVPIDRVLGLDWFGGPQDHDDVTVHALGPLAQGTLTRGDERFVLLDGRAVLDALRSGWSGEASS